MPIPESSFDLLARELGAFAGRIEREINLRVIAAVAELHRKAAEFELRMAMFEQKAAAIKDGEPGEPGKDGEPGVAGEKGLDGEIPVIPDDVAEQVAKAIAVLKESSAPVPPAMVLNINSGVSKKSKTITTRRDQGGNLVAEVVEQG